MEASEASNLGERTALANGDLVAEGNVAERGGHVRADVLVALLEALVLLHEVQVVAADHRRAATRHARPHRHHTACTQRHGIRYPAQRTASS